MKSDFLVRSEEITNLDYGRYPGARYVLEIINNGIFVLDKRPGITSHEAAEEVKKLLGIKKSGHSGTLDPNVTGVLVVALGSACKLMPALQNLRKKYSGVMHLHDDIEKRKIQNIVKKYKGKIKQKPPVKSAVARVEREREIYSLQIKQIKGRDVFFEVECEAGTYIRVLCHQIGEDLGIGAHMASLRRVAVGRFTEKMAVKIEDLEKYYRKWLSEKEESIREIILPAEAAVEHLGKIIVKDSAIYHVLNGSPLFAGGVSKVQKGIHRGDLVALLSLKGELIALGRASTDSLSMQKKRITAAKIERVTMGNDIYPKLF